MYASRERMLEDADWFENAADVLKEKARIYRKEAAKIRSMLKKMPPRKRRKPRGQRHGGGT